MCVCEFLMGGSSGGRGKYSTASTLMFGLYATSQSILMSSHQAHVTTPRNLISIDVEQEERTEHYIYTFDLLFFNDISPPPPFHNSPFC